MMQTQTCAFQAFQIMQWPGRYARVEGDRSVFHLRSVKGQFWPVVEWKTDDGIGTCVAVDCPATRELARAVYAAKIHAGGTGGGSFVINEFGLVLVPSSRGARRRYLAGQITGRLLFENPFEFDDVIDLGDCSGLRCGDLWKAPYVGMPYHLSKRSQIYFWHEHAEGEASIYPPTQDHNLIRSLRSLRRHGSVRFLVNPYGVVLTKCPVEDQWSPEETWEPCYVGRINYNAWFNKEIE
jgi:hypothetical protein